MLLPPKIIFRFLKNNACTGCHVWYCHSIASTYGGEREWPPEPNSHAVRKSNTMITTTTTSAKSSVLNLRLDDETKSLIAGEAIRDGRSMSQIALRAIKLGLAQMTQPATPPKVEAPKAPKAKAKGKRKGDDGAAPAAPVKPRPKK